MAIPDLLVMKVSPNAATVAVHKMVGGILGAQVGANVAALGGYTAAAPLIHNRVVEFRGELYCLGKENGAGIRAMVCKLGAGVWGDGIGGATAVYTTLNNVDDSGRDKSGLCIINDGATQRMFFVYEIDANLGIMRVCQTSDGAAWGENQIDVVSGVALSTAGVLFQNHVWHAGSTNVTQIQGDGIGSSAARYSTGVTNADHGAFVVFEDKLYLVRSQGAAVILSEFTGGGFSDNTVIHTAGGTFGVGALGRHTAWVVGNVIHVIAVGGWTGGNSSASDNDFADGEGSHKYTLTPDGGGGFTVTEHSFVVLPVAFRPDRAGANEDRWGVYVNTDNDPTAPEVYLFLKPDALITTGSWNVYKFIDDATLLETVAVPGPTAEYAIPIQQSGSGEHIDRGAGNRAVIISSVAASGSFELSIRVHGLLTGHVLRVYYSEDQHAPTNLATLVSVSGGAGTPVLNVNTTQIDDVDGDDGVTILLVKWNMSADGVASPDTVHLSANITLA